MFGTDKQVAELTTIFEKLNDNLISLGLDINGRAPNVVDIIFPKYKYLEPSEFLIFIDGKFEELAILHSFELIVSFYQGAEKRYSITLPPRINNSIN